MSHRELAPSLAVKRPGVDAAKPAGHTRGMSNFSPYHALFSPRTLAERSVSWFLAAVIISNVIIIGALTVPSLSPAWSRGLEWANRVCVAIFAIEYLARLYACTRMPGYEGSLSGRLRYMRQFFPLMDLIAILPALLPIFGGVNLEALRLIRLIRILSIMRLGRYSMAMQLFGRVAYTKRGEFGALMIIVTIMLLLSSSVMYYLEHKAQPEVFTSIPASLWWGIVTLTTVGYGDATPVTEVGRIVGGLIALLGVGVAALPAGIMASGLHQAVVQGRSQQLPVVPQVDPEST